MTTISSLVVEIGSDIAGLNRGLNQADKKVNNFISGMGRDLRGIGASLTGIGAQFTALTAPIGLALGAGISIASEFQDTMAELGARTGLVGQELLNVRDFALDMGAKTAFSAQQAADGLLELTASGMSAQDAMIALPGIMDAAAAGGVELGMAADSITNIMSSFGLVNPADASSIADSLVRAAGASSADFSGLTEAFANLGNLPSQFGLTVEETAAALAVLADNGIKGAEAGTQLKSMLLKLSSPEAQKAMDELGTSLYDLEGNMRPLDDVLDDIKIGMEDLPVKEQQRLMQELGGAYGIVGLSALLSAGGIDTMLGKMGESAGAADVAAARLNTFSGKMDALKGSVETLAIKALTPFMENVLTPLAEKFTDITNKVIEWTDANPELTQQIVAVAAAALVIGPALVVAGFGIQAMGVAIGALGAAFALLTSPIFLAAAGLIAIGAALAYIWTQDIGGIRTHLEDIASAFQGLDISKYTDRFRTQAEGIFTSLQGVTVDTSGVETWANQNMTAVLDTVVAVAGIVLGGPVGMTIGAAKLISTAIANDFLGIGTFLKDSGIQASIETAFTDLKTDIDAILQGVFSGGGGSNTDQALAELFASGQAVQAPQTGGALQTFVDDLKMGLAWLKDELPKITGPISDGLAALGEGIGGFIQSLSGTETEGLLRIATAIGGAIGAIITKLLELGASIVGDVLTNIGAALPAIGSFINDFVSALSRLGQGDWSGMAQRLGDSLMHFVDAGAALVGLDMSAIITTLSGLWDSVSAGITRFTEGMAVAFDWIKVNVLDPIKAAIDAIKLALDGLVGGLGAYAGAASNLSAAVNSGASPGDILGALGTAIGQELHLPGYADGGMVMQTGPAFLHAGERVLNPAETRAYNSGMGGGGNVINVNGVQDVDSLLAELARRGIYLN